MSAVSLHTPHKPKGYREPTRLPVHDMATIALILPKLRCGTCRGRLQVEPPTTMPGRLYCFACHRQYAEVVDRLPMRLTPAQWAALPIEPGQRAPARPPRRPSDRLCVDCDRVHVAAGRTRCRACDFEHRREVGLAGRLVELLRCSEPIKTTALAAMLGTNPDVVRAVVHKARQRGAPIVTVGKRYRLGVAS